MIKSEKYKKGQEFMVEWCEKNRVEIQIQPDHVLKVFECVADALVSKPKTHDKNEYLRLFAFTCMLLVMVFSAIGITDLLVKIITEGEIRIIHSILKLLFG